MANRKSGDFSQNLEWHVFGDRTIPVYESDARQFLAALRNGGYEPIEAATRMSRELLRSVQNLTRVLHRHFVAVGNPPQHPFWTYPMPGVSRPLEGESRAILEARFGYADKPEVCQFGALIMGEKHYLIDEALQFIPPLAETAEALSLTRRLVELEQDDSASANCEHLFNALCRQRWFNSTDGMQMVIEGDQLAWGYRLLPVDSGFLLDFQEAASETVASNVSRATAPDDAQLEIIALLRDCGRRMTTTEILDEFNRRGDPKAESTTKLKLANAVTKGVINNTPPHGYGLPDWP